MPNPGSPVRVESLNPATGNFEAVASTASGNVPTPEILGQRWYQWQTTAPLESRFWVSGTSGASATLRAVSQTGSQITNLTSVREGFSECLSRVPANRLADAVSLCQSNRTPQLVICTLDFDPVGPRRICPSRLLDVVAADGALVRRYEPSESVTSITLAPQSRLAWRGDAASFIDVFDQSLTEHRVSGRPDQIGLSAGSFVRLVYPQGNGAQEMTGFDPNAIAATMTGTGTSWGGAVALRVYDIGVCSSLVTWRSLMGRLQMTVSQVLMSHPEASGLRPWGRAVLTPVLRGEGPDAIGFTQRFSTAQIGATDVLVKVLIGLGLSGGQIASSADDVEVEIQGFPGAEGARTALENRLRMLIPPAVDQAARRQTLNGSVPIRRVYSRPEGLEFVLADDIADPLFTGLNAAGFCSRPTPAGSTPILAHFGSIFDPRQSGDPVVFGDP
jgi:hypothetical protein